MNKFWGPWTAADRCKECEFTCFAMVEYNYTCPRCGTIDAYPLRVARRWEYETILGLFDRKTGTVETKAERPISP